MQHLVASSPAVRAFTLGLAFPGAGWLHWTGGASLAFLTFALFGAAVVGWFATGNILLPPLVWFGSALLAALPATAGLPADVAPWAGALSVVAPVILPVVAFSALAIVHRQVRHAGSVPAAPLPATTAAQHANEISLPDLQLMRLLLDRALQPVDEFSGFEWRDQFQTAAVRYQINFMSYALSMAQANYLPAFTGYLVEAQRRLLTKQGDHRIWRYWAMENAWGNLRLNRDPVPRDNIMFTGFVAAQIAYAGQGSFGGDGAQLRLHKSGQTVRSYAASELVRRLADQYEHASFGLLACEPNWIYPLCNLISATAIRALDSGRWSHLSERFRAGLESEFMTADGRFVAFRSGITGFAPPSVGGAVMQALPCFFLNSLYPDMAASQWERLRGDLAERNWKRAFWPVDVGNYRFSRASSYAASAAAAVEMGDGDTGARLLALLDEECPKQIAGGVAHRPNASLWAHALELVARFGRTDALAGIVGGSAAHNGPYLADAAYPAVLVARATHLPDGALDAVLHPGAGQTVTEIGVAGLIPHRHYRLSGTHDGFVKSDAEGRARISLTIEGRTEVRLSPVV